MSAQKNELRTWDSRFGFLDFDQLIGTFGFYDQLTLPFNFNKSYQEMLTVLAIVPDDLVLMMDDKPISVGDVRRRLRDKRRKSPGFPVIGCVSRIQLGEYQGQTEQARDEPWPTHPLNFEHNVLLVLALIFRGRDDEFPYYRGLTSIRFSNLNIPALPDSGQRLVVTLDCVNRIGRFTAEFVMFRARTDWRTETLYVSYHDETVPERFTKYVINSDAICVMSKVVLPERLNV